MFVLPPLVLWHCIQQVVELGCVVLRHLVTQGRNSKQAGFNFETQMHVSEQPRPISPKPTSALALMT
ncbi:MAG: hypothetical protein CL913_00320 [Deltaproteobacteria bacterium]|nr:hypothetical protein [Deltaproteobacteria bacterium]